MSSGNDRSSGAPHTHTHTHTVLLFLTHTKCPFFLFFYTHTRTPPNTHTHTTVPEPASTLTSDWFCLFSPHLPRDRWNEGGGVTLVPSILLMSTPALHSWTRPCAACLLSGLLLVPAVTNDGGFKLVRLPSCSLSDLNTGPGKQVIHHFTQRLHLIACSYTATLYMKVTM